MRASYFSRETTIYFLECHGNYIRVQKKFNYVLEIDILINYSDPPPPPPCLNNISQYHIHCFLFQVSKSWKSLAEDELLWSQICHKLGHENDMSTSERDEWKEIVKIHTLRDLNLKTNWKVSPDQGLSF